MGFLVMLNLARSVFKSVVFSDDRVSAIDSGTTVTIISDLTRSGGEILSEFDSSKKIGIIGFNGATSKSIGSGIVVGFAQSRQGRDVKLRVPNAHLVKGAPHDLLSVSALVAAGYEFHFTKKGAWIVTPEMEILDLVEKSGLYWLRWREAKDPAKQSSGGATAAASSVLETSGGEVNVQSSLGEVLLNESQAEAPAEERCGSTDCMVCSGAQHRVLKMPLHLLHRRLGHFRCETLRSMVQNGALDVELSDHTHRECATLQCEQVDSAACPYFEGA